MNTRLKPRSNLQLIDYHPPMADMRADVLEGLSQRRKTLSSKYFYNERGSHLFEAITRLPEYYLTRTEADIMQTYLPVIAERIGPHSAVIEFGSGTGEKISRLLRHLENPVACIPVEISQSHLLASAEALAKKFPQLEVIAICADFTQPFKLPPLPQTHRNLVFFPGSTIGNFAPAEAIELLKVMRDVAGDNGGLLIGTDLVKDKTVLEAAYNDAQGVTAEFNLNLLRRINDRLDADFDLDCFRHEALYKEDESRIEMYLVSQKAQTVQIGEERFDFGDGERILTEYSHKYELRSFANIATQAGFTVQKAWTDPRKFFAVQYLRAI